MTNRHPITPTGPLSNGHIPEADLNRLINATRPSDVEIINIPADPSSDRQARLILSGDVVGRVIDGQVGLLITGETDSGWLRIYTQKTLRDLAAVAERLANLAENSRKEHHNV